MAKISILRFGHFLDNRGTLFNTYFYRFSWALSTNLGSFLTLASWLRGFLALKIRFFRTLSVTIKTHLSGLKLTPDSCSEPWKTYKSMYWKVFHDYPKNGQISKLKFSPFSKFSMYFRTVKKISYLRHVYFSNIVFVFYYHGPVLVAGGVRSAPFIHAVIKGSSPSRSGRDDRTVALTRC